MNKPYFYSGGDRNLIHFMRYTVCMEDTALLCQVRGHPGNRPYGLQFILQNLDGVDLEAARRTQLQFMPSLGDTNMVMRAGLLRFEWDYTPRVFFGVPEHKNELVYDTHMHFIMSERKEDVLWFEQESWKLKEIERIKRIS